MFVKDGKCSGRGDWSHHGRYQLNHAVSILRVHTLQLQLSVHGRCCKIGHFKIIPCNSDPVILHSVCMEKLK